jgi:hypothetical protein
MAAAKAVEAKSMIGGEVRGGVSSGGVNAKPKVLGG